jgi:membrane associated rhomboid family serine protease
LFIPLRDDNILVFILEVSGLTHAAVASFAVTPRELLGGTALLAPSSFSEEGYAIGEEATLLTYMFFHADVFHLVGNMLFLWVFGDNVEDAMGHLRFLVFYLACGVFAALFHAWMLPDSDLPLIGASGAVAGVIAAYLMLHPRVGVWVLAFKVIPLRITAGLALGVWIALQVVMVAMPDMGPVAWWAHIGGLIAGAVLILFMRRPGVPLFDKGLRLAQG